MLLIPCLKKTGMTLDEIKPFLSVAYDDVDIQLDENLYDLLQSQKVKIEGQLKELQVIINFIDQKLIGRKNTDRILNRIKDGGLDNEF
jgi:MerR family copper efflux transcriptional regulator